MRYLHADGYTYDDLSRLLGVTQSALADHLNGRCTCPDINEPTPLDSIDGERIREARHERNMTMDELGDEIGVGHSSISNWERELKEPRPEHLHRLIDVLDLRD